MLELVGEQWVNFLEWAKPTFIDGLKKTAQSLKAKYHILELDELYWFLGEKTRTETRENVYLMTLVSREPRQIVGFDAAFDKSPQRIQNIVDNAPDAERYCTDGYLGYIDVVYPGQHIRNTHNKKDTFTVEGVNADLRHYIPILRRRSRCFARKLETLRSVVDVFVDAYNRFGEAKYKYRNTNKNGKIPFSIYDFI
jgi:IS1 family transposase